MTPERSDNCEDLKQLLAAQQITLVEYEVLTSRRDAERTLTPVTDLVKQRLWRVDAANEDAENIEEDEREGDDAQISRELVVGVPVWTEVKPARVWSTRAVGKDSSALAVLPPRKRAERQPIGTKEEARRPTPSRSPTASDQIVSLEAVGATVVLLRQVERFSETDLSRQLDALEGEKLRCAKRRDFRAAAALRDQIKVLRAEVSLS